MKRKDPERLAEHISNLFNVTNPNSVIVRILDRATANQTCDLLAQDKRYSGRFAVEVDIEVRDKNDIYTMRIRRVA